MKDDQHEGVLSPEDLELEETVKLDENRHVVPVDDTDDDLRTPRSDTSEDGAYETEKAYSVTATVRTPDGEEGFETASNDVTEFFEEFVCWYVSRIAPDEEPEDALEVLVESSF